MNSKSIKSLTLTNIGVTVFFKNAEALHMLLRTADIVTAHQKYLPVSPISKGKTVNTSVTTAK